MICITFLIEYCLQSVSLWFKCVYFIKITEHLQPSMVTRFTVLFCFIASLLNLLTGQTVIGVFNLDELQPIAPLPSCPRHRKPWHLISDDERQLYIDGLLTLSQQGKLQRFTQQHLNATASIQAHQNSAFLPWHRYFIWELESQIRELGGNYSCFSLPYWCVTYKHYARHNGTV